MRILVVSSDQAQRRFLSETLEMFEVDAEVVEDGAAAQQRLHARRFDVIICEWTLSDMDADHLCFWQRMRITPSVYFITTFYEMDHDRALASGIDDALAEPVTVEMISDALSRLKQLEQLEKAEVFVPLPSTNTRLYVPAEGAFDLLKILVVEDDEMMHSLIEAFADELGHSLVAVMSGEEAMEKLSKESFDLIISDWMMPGMSGLELCKEVRATIGDQVYFILLTALHGQQNFLNALEMGADNYLTKPLDFDQFSLAIRVGQKALEKRRSVYTS